MSLTQLGKGNGRCGMGNEVMCLRIYPGKMVFYKGETDMNQHQARVLGNLLRAKRKELGFSTYQLAAAAGVNSSTVIRIELGQFAAPGPDKLAKFATALKMNLAEIYAKAGYIVPDDLPEIESYLQTKYPSLTGVKRRALVKSLNQALLGSAKATSGELDQESAHGIVK